MKLMLDRLLKGGSRASKKRLLSAVELDELEHRIEPKLVVTFSTKQIGVPTTPGTIPAQIDASGITTDSTRHEVD
jgi:hypothetical protein